MRLRNIFYYLTGLGFLALANAKYILRGYSTPKPFSSSEIEKCIGYDIKVVDEWLSHLRHYTSDPDCLFGKNVLELGPGSDLGIGLYLLSLGAAKYNACDVNNLVKNASDEFYQNLFDRIKAIDALSNVKELEEQLTKAKTGQASGINYVLRKDFKLASAFGEKTIDIVFSQAAFEHFDDIEMTVAELSKVCKPGAVIVAEIDLKTHSRWIRDKDPNNIYRYHHYIYKAFWCRGFPNRVRPFQYRNAFERNGWKDISIIPIETLKGCVGQAGSLNKQFHGDENQMDYLSIMLCARKR